MRPPVYPTVPTAHVFQAFGNINHALYGKTDGKHMGIDIGVTSGAPGSPIYSVYNGLCVEAGYYDQGGYGRRVVIEHETGQYSTLYAHLKDVMVKAGDEVTTGQQIGTMGGNVEDKLRGASGGTHLHFEVFLPNGVTGSIRTSKGYTVDPFPYLLYRYFPAPSHIGEVVSTTGVRIRALASKSALQIGVVNFRDSVRLMQVNPLTSTGEQWARIWSLREEWVAVEYNSLKNINLTIAGPVVVNPPVDNPPVDASAQYTAGWNAALDKMSAYILSIRS